MSSFLQRVATELLEQPESISGMAIVLPNRRAAVFLKKEISKQLKRPVFAPYITTIDEFFLQNTGWTKENNARLLFQLYEIYEKQDLEAKDDFATFCKWGRSLLADFNEIDRYLINSRELFAYLADVKRIQQWNLTPGESTDTEMINNYLKLWKVLHNIYEDFTEKLKQEKRVYQGMAYRRIAEEPGKYLNPLKERYSKIYFVGFSALNEAESTTLTWLYKENFAHFYWDIDQYYYDDHLNEAGKFLRNSKLLKLLREKGELNWLVNELQSNAREVRIIGAAGENLQMMAANNEVLHFKEKQLEEIAVVLADENALPAFLQNLAHPIKEINITMGLPLGKSPLAGFFSQLWDMLVSQEYYGRKDASGNPAYHHQYWDDLLSQPVFLHLMSDSHSIENIRRSIRKGNEVFISWAELKERQKEFPGALENILNANEGVGQLCLNLASLCEELKAKMDEHSYELPLLFSFFKLFQQLSKLFDDYKFVEDYNTARQFYRDLLREETLDLRGEPLQGLQLMGMLETRTLDFKNLILTSVNEDVLPQGRTANSLIPFEIKHQFGLPTYLDKDAVYAYHFYRLMQRAENISLIYNSSQGNLGGGEASRFIHQLEYELCRANKNVKLQKLNYSGRLIPQTKEEEIEKTPAIMQRLQEMADKGLSPTALTDYINNPLDFYYKRVLNLREVEEVEEVIAFNTQGTAIHNLLEGYYSLDVKNANGSLGFLNPDLPVFRKTEEELRSDVTAILKEEGLHNLHEGKNLLVRETLTAMLRNFLKEEKHQLSLLEESGSQLEIISLEAQFDFKLELDSERTARIHGIIDRIDREDSNIRLIDYKTGGLDPKELQIKAMEDLRTAVDKNKSFQLLMYAYLYFKNHPEEEFLQAAIVSMRSPKNWLMPCTYKNRDGISREEMDEFEIFLRNLLNEILDPAIPFSEKTILLENNG